VTYAAPSGDHPEGTKILILGILGVTLCQILAPFAWIVGNRVLREIDQSNGMMTGNRGLVVAGRILGIVGTVILVLYCGAGIFGVVLALTVDSSSSIVGG
jgi:hypothetical protein